MLTALTAPGGLWVKIINWIQSSVGSFAWTIILFTLLIKGVLSILDFFIKWSTKKSTLVQQKCAPQLEKLQKKLEGMDDINEVTTDRMETIKEVQMKVDRGKALDQGLAPSFL